MKQWKSVLDEDFVMGKREKTEEKHVMLVIRKCEWGAGY